MSCFQTRNAAYHMPASVIKPSNTREFLRGLGHQGRQEGAKAIGFLCNDATLVPCLEVECDLFLQVV